MKALSLTQPWATLIGLGEKRWETRSWATNHRGPLAIHSSLRYPKWAQELEKEEPFTTSLRAPHGNYSYPCLTLGVIVCITSVIGCYTAEWCRANLDAKELAFGDFGDGRWGWRLGPIEKRFRMAEFPVKGHLGLWNWKGTE